MTTEVVTSADGTQIAYSRHGSGPPLVFVHGASGDKHSNLELKSLLQKDFAVLSYDRRGRGESGDAPIYDFLKEADDLRAVVSTSGNRPVVFGISMGARIALELLRDPPALSAMVLFEAPATERRDPEFDSKLKAVRQEMETLGNEAGVILHSKLFHGRRDEDIDKMMRDPQRWHLRVESFPITLREMEAVHRDCVFDTRNYVNPAVPVHLLTGDATLQFLQSSAALLSKVPFIETHTISGGDHALPANAPERVFAAFSNAMSAS